LRSAGRSREPGGGLDQLLVGDVREGVDVGFDAQGLGRRFGYAGGLLGGERAQATAALDDRPAEQAAAMKGIRPVTATDACRRDIARHLLADLRRLARQVKDNEAEMRDALAVTRTHSRRCRAWGPCWPPRSSATSATSPASPPSTTSPATPAAPPLDASNGNNVRHRLNTGGNRALNSVLHIIAVCQIRNSGRGQESYLRKIAESTL
jgi:hypothetical protein